MNIKLHEVTWYSKLAAIVFFIGVLPVFAFYIGKEYGEVMSLASMPLYVAPASSSASATLSPTPVLLQGAATSTRNLRFFTATTLLTGHGGTYGNIIGYFARGNFFTYIPQWIPDNWSMKDLPGYSIKFSPKVPEGETVDFSDIVVSVATTTEKYNAETLYSKEASTADKTSCLVGSRCEVRDPSDSIITSEILLSTVGDTRIYHLAESLSDGTIQDRFFIDGRDLTATITFSADKDTYPLYENKIREFVQGIGKGDAVRG